MHRKENIATIQRLTRASSEARGVIARDVTILRHRLDAPARLKRAVKSNPLPWLGASAVLGLITSRIFRRKRKATPAPVQRELQAATKGGFLITLFGLAFTTLRPLLQRWATQRLHAYLEDRVRYGSTSSPELPNFRPSNPL
jgi:hypothetical protein